MSYRFIFYGLLGWGLEIIWTGIGSAFQGDLRLAANTYVWMFPIYGLAIFLEPVHNAIRLWPWFLRGFLWVILIWVLEYVTGGLIKTLVGVIPWDYTGYTRWEINGLIRLDMAPVWMVTGLLFEKVHDFLVRKLEI